MKIVHISTYLSGGAGSAAYRLHKALLQNEVDSSFLYLHGSEIKNEPDVHKLPWQKDSFVKRGLRKISGNKILGPDRSDINNKRYDGIRAALKEGYASIPYSRYNVLQNSIVKQSDILHLHGVAGMVDFPSFFRKNKKPVVWTLHDENPMKSLYHYSGDEKANGHIASELDKEMIAVKINAIQKRDCSLVYVTPSEWLHVQASKSDVFKNVPGVSIFNTLDIEEFYPLNKLEVRSNLNIPAENTVFLFVAEAVNYSRKGFDLLMSALEKLSFSAVTLIVVGNNCELKNHAFDIRNTGSISDPKKLIEYYSVADAFIIPSREDNLPNVMLESMACGTPVLSFNVGGMASMIIDKFNGLKANKVTADGLADILKEFIKTKQNYNNSAIRKYAEDNFSFNVIADRYKKIYNEVMA